MQIHDLTQGSSEWHAHRSNYWNASDAPAMMGVSKYKTRAELLHERHTGIAPDVDAATQRRFDEGHRFEALARLLAEEIIGESLYPVTGTEGRFSASFDGLTMLEDVIYEHKRLNDSIRAAATVDDLDQMYHVQMEQQCLVSGATKVLFLATNWDEQGNLLEEKHFWYEPNLELRERIVQGWSQFEMDFATYVPVIHADKPRADAIMQLPALAVQIRGEVLASNLPDFEHAAARFLTGINTDLQSDEDFANAEATVKFCDEVEKNLAVTKKMVIAQAADIDDVVRRIDLVCEEVRGKRLTLDKLVKSQKETIKNGIVAEGRLKFADHVAALEAEIKPIRLVYLQPDFQGAIKNKRTLASLHDAVDSTLANAKIATDAIAKDVRAKLAWYREYAKGHEFLFADLQSILYKPEDDFQLLVKNRIDQHKADEAKKLEVERERIQAEEQRKAAAAIAAAQAQASVPQPSPAVVIPHPVQAPVKSDAKPAYSPALMSLARHELTHIRKKYSVIPELAALMREIDAFLASTEEQREMAEA